MSKKKILAGILIALVIVALQVGAVFAAPSQQTTNPPTTPTSTSNIPGTIQSIVLSTDVNGATIVVVTYIDSIGNTQTVNLDLTTAEQMNLVTLDSNGNPVVNTSMIVGSTSTNPVADILQGFFSPDVLSDQTIAGLHDDGYGYGVIAQSCFMAGMLGSNVTCKDVLDAKNGDFSSLKELVTDLPSNVDNWGQLKKYAFQQALKNDENSVSKSLDNLGGIVSGRNKPSTGDGTSVGGTGGATGDAITKGPSGSFNDNLDKTSHGKGGGRDKGNHGKGH